MTDIIGFLKVSVVIGGDCCKTACLFWIRIALLIVVEFALLLSEVVKNSSLGHRKLRDSLFSCSEALHKHLGFCSA